jgi:hypothetical protein
MNYLATAASPSPSELRPSWRLPRKPLLFAVGATVTVVLLRSALKSKTGKTVLGTVTRGAIAGAVRALPQLVLLEIGRRARARRHAA